ncbi:hypothetical protein TKK_0004473 [Trichogramma kaykai]
MSSFKRNQSKVFWRQMEAADLNKLASCSPLPVINNNNDNNNNNNNTVDSKIDGQSRLQRKDEEDEEDIVPAVESDTTSTDSPDNVTVIHLDPAVLVETNNNNDASSLPDASSHSVKRVVKPIPATRTSRRHAIAVEAGGALAAEVDRPLSPARSRGQRSQDSGFSDSDCSSSNNSPRHGRRHHHHHHRRRSSRRKQQQQREQEQELQLEKSSVGAQVPQPQVAVLTSTPKQQQSPLTAELFDDVVQRQIDQIPVRNHLHFGLDNDGSSHNRDDTSPRESLRDFLYGDDRMFNNEQIQHHKSSSSPSPVSSYCDDDDDDFEEDDDAEREAISRSPAQVWLTELRDDCEDECQATLQSKSLPKRSRARYPCEAADAHDLRLLTASATTAAKKIVDAAGRFDRSYHKLTQSMLAATSSKSKQLRDSLGRFEAEASDILVKLGSTLPRRLASHEDQPRTMALQLAKLKNHVDRALDRRLDFYIEKVVRGLEEAPRQTGSTARGALAALTALALAGPRAAASIARCAGVRALLLSLVSAGRLSTDLRCACLRALACVCSCLEAVDQFVAEAGPEILVDLLAAPETPEAEKSEAAALVVQLTAPWIERMGLPHLEAYCERLVEALTELAEATHDKQTLLLAAAAINHLSHSRHSIRHIVERDSIKKLLRCVKKSQGGNVWLMEQVAALVGQVARVPQARAHLAKTRASVALVCFLRMQPPGHEDEYRRLEATASEALTRLCVDPEIAEQVVAIGGANFLPEEQQSSQSQQSQASSHHPQQNFASTKSLRRARKIAAQHIGNARIYDISPR